MRTNQDIEGYIIKMGLKYEEVGEGTWVIHDEQDKIDNIVVRHDAPVLVFRVKLMELPKHGELTGLFRTLLELNMDMVSGAYGLEGNAIVATDTIQSENLDYNEFEASLDGLTMCITDHYPKLVKYVELNGAGASKSAQA
ncbi:MAG: YbjN domain-containing protein [Myxococcota bacterium]